MNWYVLYINLNDLLIIQYKNVESIALAGNAISVLVLYLWGQLPHEDGDESHRGKPLTTQDLESGVIHFSYYQWLRLQFKY